MRPRLSLLAVFSALATSLVCLAGSTPVIAVAAPAPDSAATKRSARNPIERWNQMTPEERERELAKLPPARARIIRERIRRYNQLPEPEREALTERYRHFAELPADKQQVVRERLRQFRQLPAARRPLVHAEVVRLRGLSEADRRAQLNGADFRSRFSPDEQQIIRDITENFPTPVR
ncbi:MAG: DUF3106 domain-containing protein [Bryobacteraceae bacterium]